MKNILEIRPYEDGDIQFVRQDPFQEVVKDYPDLPVPANSYTCVFEGIRVGVGGIKMYFEGVGEAWLMMTKQSKKDGIFGLIACRTIKRKLEELIVELKLRRCEAQVRADFDIGIRFIKALGFKQDCIREKYNLDGTNMILFSRVFE